MTKEQLINKIEGYNHLKEQTEKEKKELNKHFISIFQAIKDVQEKNNRYRIFGENNFGKWYDYEWFERIGDKIILHYYDSGCDCYYGEKFCIPIEAAETPENATEWAEKEVKKQMEEKERIKKQKEIEKEEREMAEYKRLKEKYEN